MSLGISCRDCVWFTPGQTQTATAGMGQCRRNPPQLLIGERGIKSFWPLVHGDHGFCGEHTTATEVVVHAVGSAEG